MVVTALQAVLVLKLLAVMTYAGGLVASFVSSSLEERRRAAHNIASPALFVIWCVGYTLVWLTDVALTELWIVGGLALSFVANAALVHSVNRDRRTPAAFATCVLPLIAVVMVMVFKPTWQMLWR
jgi:hypothetical protein